MAVDEERQSDILQVTVDAMGRLGEGIARSDRGPIFIPGVIPGERVSLHVVKRRRFPVGRVLELLSPSPHRIPPRCPYFGDCTGCQWQHVDYSFQLGLKREKVENEFRRAGIDGVPILPVLPSPRVSNYRNHARFTVKDGVPGFVRREGFRFVPVDECLLMDERINAVLRDLKGTRVESSQLSVRCGAVSGEMLIQPQLGCTEVVSGQKVYHESLSGRRFRISAASFFQVNTLGAEMMVELVGRSVEGAGVLLDAYAGVGTFSAVFSSRVGEVIAVEESPSAGEDAAVNLVGAGNVRLLKSKTEYSIQQMESPPDVVILDPPRSGCHARVIEALLGQMPEKIVYISCEPLTLARDLKLLQQKYVVREVQPVDLFPHTHHVECVAALEPR